MEFIYYPKCSTCIKAKKYLDELNIKYIERDIKILNPTYDEIKSWILKYNVNLRKLFNTSGLIYKELSLKDKIDKMNEDELIKLLSSNGMLVKRPILLSEDYILIGFKINEWDKLLK